MFDSFEKLNGAFQQAQAKLRQGDLLGAYNLLLEIFTDRLLHSKLIDADLKVIQSLADLASLLGEFQAADQLLYSVIMEYERANSQLQADYSRLRRVQLLLDRGDLYQVRHQLQVMAVHIGDIENIQFSSSGLKQWELGCVWLDAAPQERTIIFVELYLVMGRLLSALGQYSDALRALNRGLFYAEAKGVPALAQQTVIPLKLAMATARFEKGELKDADTNLTYLKEELDEHQHPEHYIKYLEISGKVHLLQGELGKALGKFRQVQEKCRSLKAGRALLRSNLNLAHVLILLNQTSTAQSYLENTKEKALAIKDSALASRAQLLVSLASARGRSLVVGTPVGHSVKGMRHPQQDGQSVTQQEATLDLKQSSNYLTWFEDRALAFQWQLSRFNFLAAGNLLSQIQEAFKFSDSELIRVKIKILEGMLAYYQGVENQGESTTNKKFRWATLILDEVRPTLRDLGLKPELWQVQRILGWCLSRLKRPAAEQETLAKETNNLLTELTESLSPEDQAIYLLNKWTADEEYIAAQINQLQRLREKLINGFILLRPWRRWLLMQRLNALLEHIDRYKDVLVKRTIKGRNADVENAPVSSLWRRFLTHQKKRVTLSFLVLPDRVFVVRAWRFFLDFAVIPTTRLEVRNTVQRWHKKIQGTQGGRDFSDRPDDDDSDEPLMTRIENECKEIANYLAEILEIPSLLEGLPKNTQALTIVPDDILHGFPFATIIHQGKYLVEHYALSIAYESSGQKSPTPPSEQVQNALIVGVSKGIIKRIPPLPAVRAEIKQVKHWLTGHRINSCTLLDNSAHKGAVIDGLSKATLLHMACHGTFEHNRPDQSGLVLIPNSEQEEILSLRELSNLDLTGLHHATLSSCWSADNLSLPGRWIISIPETLWRSGVQSILGCLWEVYDQVAVSFMTRFYDYLDDLPRDEALRRTQLDCLQGKLPKCSIDTANPIYWSGFSLYGDYTRLDLQHRVRDIGSIQSD
ncbi:MULTISPECIES: CHAT domain-containing protein [unclassified Moorena]|uniref:CHAT domain-containing protein n=1 Tax=unclassified Moorena TaxID=2683338 RepID=UPI0014006A80|nr:MULTISPECIES: CHAT domain-containing protein [unclassified Moorena]NEO13604.1 CHAT domain-containing protein [Moorena sp. SIO3E8]NEP99930.1 CHAT domain-containing protein [Moorena sp. SIO3F7]